jgi:hypothetical protein
LRQASLAIDNDNLSGFNCMVDDSQPGTARLTAPGASTVLPAFTTYTNAILTVECLRRNTHGIGLFGVRHRVDEKSAEAIL